MFSNWQNNRNSERKFDVYKREGNGFVHKVGTILADNKVQADTKARMMYAKHLAHGEAVWAVDPSVVAANNE